VYFGNVRAVRLRRLALQFGSEKTRVRGSTSASSLPKRPPPCPLPCQRRGDRKISWLMRQQICFTKVHSLAQPRVVGRSFAVCIVLAVLICCARGQDQERKLVDRLLKPDMALQNDAQNKKFTGDGSASINKRASVGSFYIHQQARSKNFPGTRDFATSRFYSQTYHRGRSTYEASSQQTMTNSQFAHANQTASGVRDAPQSGKKVASRAYPGNRPFLDEGKSQKSLNQQNAPLTIDQVRELLNKNK
jgi:hypothetical protein